MWYIRKESKVVLGRVVALMNKYHGMVIEIGLHTDSHGNAKFNEELSQKKSQFNKRIYHSVLH